MVRARRRIAIWLAWFVVLNVVWLALVATLNWQEEIAGVISAAIGATAAEAVQAQGLIQRSLRRDRKSTRLNSSHMSISYAVFCLKKKRKPKASAAAYLLTDPGTAGTA